MPRTWYLLKKKKPKWNPKENLEPWDESYISSTWNSGKKKILIFLNKTHLKLWATPLVRGADIREITKLSQHGRISGLSQSVLELI